jgi:hypothetical protein
MIKKNNNRYKLSSHWKWSYSSLTTASLRQISYHALHFNPFKFSFSHGKDAAFRFSTASE